MKDLVELLKDAKTLKDAFKVLEKNNLKFNVNQYLGRVHKIVSTKNDYVIVMAGESISSEKANLLLLPLGKDFGYEIQKK